jgi:signal transduction histidine kinase/CheY-like chemotaxis protein
VTAFRRGVHPEDQAAVKAAIERATADGAPFDVEFRSGEGAGAERRLALRGQGQAGGDGRPVHLIGVVLDVTERRGLERQLIQAQKMEAIGNLAGGIAHDFNNQLTGMIGHLKFAQRALPPGTQVRADVDEVERAARRAAELTSQLLSYARRQMIMPTIVNLNDAVLALEPMLRRLLAENITIDIDLAADLWPTRVDAGQLEQVLVNLAVNARDAMPDGGTLRIATRNVRDGGDAGDFAEVLMEDTGVGMSADVLSRIFDPFFTTKPVGQGTGLGLAMCYGIVKQADGHIAVNSELGIGTTFRVRLPRAAEVGALSSARAVDGGDTPGGSETILLAEDDAGLRELAARTLREAGYRVLEASDGFDAQALAVEHGESVDMLLTDVVMPKRSGRELAAELRRARPSLPVLFMSGYTDAVPQGAGSDPLLSKPFTPEELRLATRRLLDARRPAPA